MKYALKQFTGDNNIYFSNVLKLRKEIFAELDGYPEDQIRTYHDENATHFVLLKENAVVGSVSVHIKKEKIPLPVEHFLDLSEKSDLILAEISKLIIIEKYRNKPVSLYLMVIAYDFLISNNINGIVIGTLSSKQKNIRMYKKFGFKQIGSVNKKGQSQIKSCARIR